MIQNENASASPNAGAELLLAAATPELYRRNAFRTAELPVDVAARDLSRRQQRLEVAARTGLPAPPGPGRALPLEQDAQDGDAEDGLREALQRLRDPERRLIDELFWFWPLEPGHASEDEALAALARDDVEAATTTWRRVERRPDLGGVALHNLAVLTHAVALDLEVTASSRPLTPAEQAQRDFSWQQALECWRRLLESESFWSRLGTRVRELDDPRLTSGAVRRLREALPRALLQINAGLALQAAERGLADEVGRQSRLMRQAGWPADALDEALRRVLEPTRARILQLCKSAEAEADSDPAHGDRATRGLIEHTRPLLALLDALLPAGHSGRDGSHDEVALRILACQIPFGNRTQNWAVSLELLEAAIGLAATATARERLQENITIVRGNVDFERDFGTCWFCRHCPGGGQRGSDADVLEIKMFGDIVHTPTVLGTNVRWNNTTVKIPRCPTCRGRQGRSSTASMLVSIAGLALAFGNCNAASNPSSGNWPVILFFIIAIAGFVIAATINHLLLAGVKGDSWKLEFPRVKELKGKGWEFGEKPAGVN